MDFVPFFKYFSELADTETRVLTIKNSPDLDDGDYGFVELYCSKPGCDCRRVHIMVIKEGVSVSLADINFGWDSPDYYTSFHGYTDDRAAEAILNPLGTQSKYAPYLLNCFKQLILDQDYLERIRRHYRMVKQACKTEAHVRSSCSNHQKAIAKKKKKKREKSARKKAR